MMAPYLNKSNFLKAFENNILDVDHNTQMAKDLCGIGDSKPWDCVGDTVDTAASLSYLGSQNEWASDVIPHALVAKLHDKFGESHLKDRLASELTARKRHFIPEQLAKDLSGQATMTI
ncbi:MAG: hypothetical protein HKM24_01980 [Gammaproteobacteria bacterium]|nr:hypothetical protein [Gammaproteobacteria bacterium]